MNSTSEETFFQRWFFPVAAGLILVLAAAVIAVVRPPREPADAVKGYIDALAAGKCRGAYGMVSSFAKEYSTSYRTLKDFRENVCEPMRGRYEEVSVFKVDGVEPSGDGVVVVFRLRFKTSWMPRSQDRPMRFNLKRKGRRWLLDGPDLVF